jgi:maleamate amidohydrolase
LDTFASDRRFQLQVRHIF